MDRRADGQTNQMHEHFSTLLLKMYNAKWIFIQQNLNKNNEIIVPKKNLFYLMKCLSNDSIFFMRVDIESLFCGRGDTACISTLEKENTIFVFLCNNFLQVLYNSREH